MTGGHDSSGPHDPHWWRQAVVYQVYPRSFADSNGDGIGDLAGLVARVDYLRDLGVDAVWLNPFYPSALADGGYDVDDYRDVDPKLGSLTDFDDLVEALHAAGLRIFIDIVPNHTSNRHAWFRAALAAAPGSMERDRYHFRDGRGESGELPPNDWPSFFGSSAWTRVVEPDGRPGQWYLHLFAPEQPDLNWDNPEVHADFITTLRFWADRGVDGFRVDVAHGLVKDMSEPYPPVEPLRVVADYPVDGSHPLVDRDAVHDIYRQWRSVFNEYDPPRVAVAEATVPAERRARYATLEGLGQAFNFELVEARWDATSFRTTIARGLEVAASTDSSSTWTLSNHDIVRHASRYGLPADIHLDTWLLGHGADPPVDPDLADRRARAAALLMLALPGSIYLYQGEELGLLEVADLPEHVLQDPIRLRDRGVRKGRDGCRVPIPWTSDSPAFGFTTGTPHLPMPSWFAGFSAQSQDGAADSMLELYRDALLTRRVLQTSEGIRWHDGPEHVLGFTRDNGWASITNFGFEPVGLPSGLVVLTSAPLTRDGRLPGDTTVWLRTPVTAD